MKSFQLKAKAKLGAEVNVARILQSFTPAAVHSSELRQVRVDPPEVEGDVQKTEVTVTRRKEEVDPPAPDYELRCVLRSGERLKSCLWKGKSDDSGKFAVAYAEGSEVRLMLVDHWYKFARVAEGTTVVQEAETRRQKRVKKRAIDEESDVSEELDFVADFPDDEEGDEPQCSSLPSAPRKLTASGRALRRVLHAAAESSSVSPSGSSIGLDDSSDSIPPKKPLTKPQFCREMARLKKVRKEEIYDTMVEAFDFQSPTAEKRLWEYIRSLTREVTEGAEQFYVLRDDVKVPRQR